MFKWGVCTFIWTENFSKGDIKLIKRAKSLGFEVIDIAVLNLKSFPVLEIKKEAKSIGVEVVTMMILPKNANLVSPEKRIRKRGINLIKRLVDINTELESNILTGILYAPAGYITGKPRTKDEWNWSVESMREVCLYANEVNNDLNIAVECANRFETHILNIAEDAVKYCKDVGTNNIKVHLDTYHMIREERSFKNAVEVCRNYLGYVHVCENNRGIPGTGLVPWTEFFSALKKINYKGPLVIEAFDPNFERMNRITATWRKYTSTGEELAVKGLENLKKIERSL